MPVSKLTPEQFDDSLLPIFKSVKREVGDAAAPFRPEGFFPRWRQLMQVGIAHTWAVPGVVLGASLSPCLFSGDVQAHVVFWFALPEARGTGISEQVFAAFNEYATGAGAKVIYVAAYKSLSYEKRAAGYEKNGFENIESTFRKRIK